jgi:hypothetical protein
LDVLPTLFLQEDIAFKAKQKAQQKVTTVFMTRLSSEAHAHHRRMRSWRPSLRAARSDADYA